MRRDELDDEYWRGARFGCLLGVVASVAAALLVSIIIVVAQ